MYEYGIGGQEVPRDASEATGDIPQNRSLILEKLTADAPLKPEVVEGLKTVEEVFAHYKPSIEVDFRNEDGVAQKENLSFSNLGDFGVKGITSQSNYLQSLQNQRESYMKMIKQLKTNKLLKQAIENGDYKMALVNALQSMIQEIDDAG